MKPIKANWESLIVSPDAVIKRIKPGMSIFLSTGAAEPRTMVKHLMGSTVTNLDDLELTQLVSFSDTLSLKALKSQNFHLKTFFSGWASDKAIEGGRIDLIPIRYQKISDLFSSGQIPIDMAIVQVTPPNDAGYCSLGIAVDVAWEAMEKASIAVGEINHQIPRTFGDTFIPVSEFDYLVLSTEPPFYFERWQVDEVMEKVACNVAALVDDGSCLAFSIGPLYEALGKKLQTKHHLGIHSPYFTDPLLDLVKSDSATNRLKKSYRGKSLTSYALGTPELMAWIDNNPMVEFQPINKVFNPLNIGRNPNFVTIIAARTIDLYGRVGLHTGKGNVAAGPAEVTDFFFGAGLSHKGRTIFALTSRNLKGHPNIVPCIDDFPNQLSMFESVSTVVTEHGVAYLEGRTLRERAQALIEIAHPDDRALLVEEAKSRKILYSDQIFLLESARLYPSDVNTTHTFKGDLKVRFRAIKPSDEERMRHLFYRFSDETTYYRYFHSISSMPHSKMQEYVNVDWNKDMSIVGLTEEKEEGQLIAEARYSGIPGSLFAELVFVVDEKYHSRGIATYMYKMLIRLAKERGLKGLVADVLFSNQAMMKVFYKGELPVHAHLEDGVYHLSIPFES